MRYYRLYFLDALTGRIRRFAEFEASGDHEALLMAEETGGDAAFELWCGDRRVHRNSPARAGGLDLRPATQAQG